MDAMAQQIDDRPRLLVIGHTLAEEEKIPMFFEEAKVFCPQTLLEAKEIFRREAKRLQVICVDSNFAGKEGLLETGELVQEIDQNPGFTGIMFACSIDLNQTLFELGCDCKVKRESLVFEVKSCLDIQEEAMTQTGSSDWLELQPKLHEMISEEKYFRSTAVQKAAKYI